MTISGRQIRAQVRSLAALTCVVLSATGCGPSETAASAQTAHTQLTTTDGPKPADYKSVPTTDGIVLATQSVGAAGAPLVVVVNGGPGLSSYHVEHYLDAISEHGFQVVTFDQRNIARSMHQDPATATIGYGFDAYVGDLEAIRQAYGAEKFHLIGESFGGLLSQAYIARHPERVASVVLAGSITPERAGWEAWDEKFAARQAALQQSGHIPADDALPEDVNGYNVAVDPVYYYDPTFKLPRWDFVISNVVYTATSEQVGNYDFTASNGRFTSPTAIIFGEGDVGLFGKEKLEESFAQANPFVRVIEKAGHIPADEQPAKYYETLTEFYSTRGLMPSTRG